METAKQIDAEGCDLGMWTMWTRWSTWIFGAGRKMVGLGSWAEHSKLRVQLYLD
eukprot:COSAG01_NODE_1280_length_10925_cov_23.969333_3_plen_54_part_00